jgi:hypothetical protein
MYESLDELMGRRLVMLSSRLFRLSCLVRQRRRTSRLGGLRYVMLDLTSQCLDISS